MALLLGPPSQCPSSLGSSEQGWEACFLSQFTADLLSDLGNLCAL